LCKGPLGSQYLLILEQRPYESSVITIIILPLSFSTLSSNPILCKCSGVATDRAMTSPIASWNPVKNNIGISGYLKPSIVVYLDNSK